MRQKYYDLLRENKLKDGLKDIKELPYSAKYKLILSLLGDFDYVIINRAFDMYYKEYIKLNRVRLVMINNMLNKICKVIKGE